ncbi:ANTAR domain-containing protein [Pseudonocardia bannensis]|uniref:GAF and ANTAR domain-containing protein n=1 Tax=Pseudonocardia bannensis TaxID=630973 RepID=A0A848DK07_9PSEU|nr:ANTAR domain-containing protein [Pseudonocardia bannensis]NMH93050.1 GAF and ANTAR domain-containing protein [Pseudonocardia bannensis]
MPTDQDWAEDKQLFVEGEVDRFDGLSAAPGPLAAEFVALSAALLDATTVQDVLRRVVRAGRAVVEGADLVSVTMRASGGGFHTPVETDELATRLDELQYRFDEGPCIEAARATNRGVTASADLGAGREYPRFGPAAAGMGMHSVLAVGLFPHGDPPRMGALNFYSFQRNGLDETDRDIALVLAAHASTALAATQACTATDLEAAQLREALRSRDVIGQAKGILMERRGITAAEAFEVLRSASQSLNIKLARVAETLVSRRADL